MEQPRSGPLERGGKAPSEEADRKGTAEGPTREAGSPQKESYEKSLDFIFTQSDFYRL